MPDPTTNFEIKIYILTIFFTKLEQVLQVAFLFTYLLLLFVENNLLGETRIREIQDS